VCRSGSSPKRCPVPGDHIAVAIDPAAISVTQQGPADRDIARSVHSIVLLRGGRSDSDSDTKAIRDKYQTMITTLRTVVQPGSEPIDLSLAKMHARVYNTYEDSLISSLITSARQTVEEYLSRVLVQQTLVQTIKYTANQNLSYTAFAAWGYPQSYFTGWAENKEHHGAIELARSPFQTLNQLCLRDHLGNQVDLVAQQSRDNIEYYVLDAEFDPARPISRCRRLFR